MEKGRILTGARARFSLNGIVVGYCRQVTLGENITYEGIKVLNLIQFAEHVPVGYDVRFSASFFRLVGETFKSKGLFPNTGVGPEEHLENILTSGELVATIEDVKTGRVVFTVEQVKIASVNWTITAEGVVGEDVEFVAIRMKDESEIV